jgi:hypothetical protein
LADSGVEESDPFPLWVLSDLVDERKRLLDLFKIDPIAFINVVPFTRAQKSAVFV